jgi:hypothetical protein
LSKTVAHGISVGSWKTKLTSRVCSLARFSSAGHSIAPADGSSRPAIMRSAVLLPQPDGPSRLTNSPRRTSRLMSRKATVPFE